MDLVLVLGLMWRSVLYSCTNLSCCSPASHSIFHSIYTRTPAVLHRICTIILNAYEYFTVTTRLAVTRRVEVTSEVSYEPGTRDNPV